MIRHRLSSYVGRLLPTVLLSAAIVATPSAAQSPAPSPAAVEIVIGIAAPLSGSSAILGRQVAAGVEAAVRPLDENSRIERVEADTACDADGGSEAARTLAAMKVDIVVGFLCIDAIEAALPILKEAGIPTLDVGVRANRLTDRRERTGNLVWRIAPRSDAIATKIAATIGDRWADEPFGLIDDGSIAARGLSDTVRRLLADRGIEPQTVDNFRPAEEKQFGLARRLERSGVTRFFIAGDRPDVATIVRDAGELGLSLDIVGSESLFDEVSADVPLAEGVVSIAPKNRFPALADGERSAPAVSPTETTETAGEAAAITDAEGPQGYFGSAYAATQIAATVATQAKEAGKSLASVLATTTFSTALGPIGFDANGDSNLDLFRVFRWSGDRFVPEAGG